MKLLENSSRTEKAIFRTSVILMILALFLFLSDEWYARVFGGFNHNGNGTYLGNIALTNRDVRYKRGRHFDWEHSLEDQKIYIGDSVFVGANSQATVRIGESNLDLSENSLVRFSARDGKALADLVGGVFQLSVGSETQVLINGVATTFKGSKDAKIEIKLDDKAQPQIKVLRGVVDLKTENEKKTVVKTLSSGVDYKIAAAVPAAESFYFPPTPSKMSSIIQYNWRLYDIYNTENKRISIRPFKPSQVHASTALSWLDTQPGPYRFELSTDSKFDRQTTLQKTTDTSSVTVDTLLVGENFWRVSRKENDWSQVARLNVVTGYNGEAPRFKNEEIPVWLVDERAPSVRFEWETLPEYKGYVLEGSQDSTFPTNATQVYWKTGNTWQGSFKSAGTYYFRLRGVHQNHELTEYGRTLKLSVEVPPLLEAPRLAQQSEFIYGQPADLKWNAPRGSEGYRLTLHDQSGHQLLSSKIKSPNFSVSDLPPASYSYQVAAIDRWGREGYKSTAMRFKVTAPPAEPKRLLAAEEPPRVEPPPETPIAQPASTLRLRTEKPVDFNLNYNRSFVQIEGASAAVVSSEQSTYGNESPLLGTVGLRGLQWWKNNGIEASMKAKAFGYNAAAENTAPLQIEARMHHRWVTPWTWFSFLHQLQASVLAGLEVYRNGNGANLYSKGYEIAKLGLSLKFPLGRNWDTGGELTYGLGFDASRKYEVSGGLYYDFKTKWAFGFGYRVQFFEAGSEAAAPYILPYREAQGEGFTMLRYNY